MDVLTDAFNQLLEIRSDDTLQGGRFTSVRGSDSVWSLDPSEHACDNKRSGRECHKCMICDPV
jgi:hypothetical protein